MVAGSDEGAVLVCGVETLPPLATTVELLEGSGDDGCGSEL